MSDDARFLALAVDLARRNLASREGGPFGAVVVAHGQLLGEGRNQVIRLNDPSAHAEIQAIRQACARIGRFHLPDATLYASSEPCPMCLAAAYWAHIPRVVYANARAEAAAIGFCDDDLYAELALPAGQRRIQLCHHPLPDALEPLKDWFSQPDRIAY